MIINGGFLTMGTKRVGLARMEALMEGLKRDLNLVSTTLTSPTISKAVSLTAAKLHASPSTANAAPTAMTAIALAVNTFYKSRATGTAMTIPSCAAGNIGDHITVFYDTAITNGQAHTYTTTTDTTFALGSTCQRVGGGVASMGSIAVAADNVLTITGNTNGDGGVGTVVRFVNMTAAANGWAVEAITYGQGTNAQAGTIAFS